MENTDVNRINGHAHRVGQHAYEEMRHAVTDTVERGSKMVKTLEKRMETRPYLTVGIGLGVATVVLGAGALIAWMPRRRRGFLGSVERLVGDVFDTTLHRLKTAI